MVVLYSPDRRWRITADEAGRRRYTVEYDLIFQAHLATLPALEAFLAQRGVELADLIQD